MGGFKVNVEVRSNNRVLARKDISLPSRKNLFAAIKREFSDMKFIIDRKFGAEVSELAGLKKSENAGLHFTIDGKVPWVKDEKTGEKLYLSLYHIEVARDMRVVIELVSVSCDYANSVVDARLEFRTDRFDLEALPSFGKNAARYRSWQSAPDCHVRITNDLQAGAAIDYFRYFLAQNARNFGAFRRKERARGQAYGFSAEFFPAPSEVSGPGPSFKPSEGKPIANEANLPFPQAGVTLVAADVLQMPLPGHILSARQAGQPRYLGGKIKLVGNAKTKNSGNKALTRAAVQTPFGPAQKSLPKKRAIPISSLSDFKAVIFDLDGIIVDSEAAHLMTFNRVLRERGLRIDGQTWRNNYTGIGSLKIMKDVFRRNGIREDILPTVVARAKTYQSHVEKNGLPEIAGFKKFQRNLSENRVKFMVASGGHKPSIAASLKSIGLPQVKFVGLEDVKHGKPNPEIFLLAAKKLGAKPSQCVVFEDSLSGMEAAARAGMPCVALSTTLPVRILKGRASAVFRDYNSPGLKALFARLIMGRKRKQRASRGKKMHPGQAPPGKQRKKKFRRQRLLRLWRR